MELSQETSTIAKYLAKLNDLNYRVFVANALEFDYSKYDFIYMFHPIYNKRMYCQLLNQILTTAKEGALLLETLHYDDETSIIKGYKNREILVKITNGKFELLEEDENV